MKIYTVDGVVTAQAETLADINTLMSLENVKKTHKPHKKHNFMKACPKCGKLCKGLKGLGIHKAKCLVAPIAINGSPKPYVADYSKPTNTPLARSYEM